MRVSTIRLLKIQNLLLPDKVEGNYWLEGTDENGIKRNLISIEASDGKWKLVSNDEVYCVENNQYVPFVYLEEGKFYSIKNSVTNENFKLYCSPVLADYNCYNIETYLQNGITIGSNVNNLITYDIIDFDCACIKNIEGKIYIIDNNSKDGVYVNDVRVIKSRVLEVGDIVFIDGLKLIFSITSDMNHCLYINNNTISNVFVKSLPLCNVIPNNNSFEEPELEVEFPLYEEKDFFHKTPRFFQKEKPLILQVDAPPVKTEEQNSSIILTIGPMITMSMTSIVTGYTAVNNVLSGEITWSKAMPSLIICVAMLASVFIWPLITKAYEKKLKAKNEKLRQEKYSEYIASKKKAIIEAKIRQTAILKNNYISSEEASDIITRRYTTLWQRRVEDEDFLEVNLGSGSYPMKIEIKYPEDHFSMLEDNLKNMVLNLGQEPKLLANVPVILSFRNTFISGIVGGNEINEYTRRLLIQLLAMHSYDELKIVFLTDEEKEYHWRVFKSIPHCFTDDKKLRFFATDNDEYKEICYYLDKIFDYRNEKQGHGETDNESFNQSFLIITDSFKKVRNFDIIKKVLESKKYLGFSLVILDNKLTNLPNQCSNFIVLNQNEGELRNNQNINDTIEFALNYTKKIDYDNCTKTLANIPIELSNNDENQIPDKIGFLEMYDVGKVEQLNSLSRWQKNNPILNLQVPVGIGKSGEKITIDLHEKYHGPHGLIAGMTGSGKSEFIITYILSMAVNYHPYEVQFILIDYKGGGLAGAFENNNIGLKLPHLVGTITNLDVNEIKRSLASIESELKRRQTLFNKAREISGESTIDIYKYQKMFREGSVEEPISHLFIISDEFAELKNQQPEFMEQLISTARIGRSLGVHLILATQKPSGVVDPQIWSNTRFRVCMRVQDKSDSNEVIKCPDAAYLKHTGRFYFQVGFNEVFLLGQAAYAGGKYIPSEKVTKTLDTTIDFIDNIGYTLKKVDTKVKTETVVADKGEELINIVKYLDNIAKEQNIKCKPLWLEKIPEDIRVESLSQKYNYKKEDYIINPIIGEYDIPSRQEQSLLTLPLTKEGNVLVYGSSGSGKENFVTTLIYSSSLYYSPEEINYYIIDFGSESLKMFSNCPIVGDILNSDDDEKINNLYKMLNKIIDERKILFSDYNGDYYTYCKNTGKKIPSIVVVINNYESYQETYSQFDETLIVLTRECNRYGIFFVLTVNTPNGLRFKLRQNFSLIYALQQNNDDDYTTILGNVHKNYPAKIFGRGIFKIDDVYEFQTALVYEKDNIIKYVKKKNEELKNKYSSSASSIPTLPKSIGYKEISEYLGEKNKLVIGIDKSNLEVCKFDFNKNYVTVVSLLDLSMSSNFVNALINQILLDNNSTLAVINAEDYYINEKYRDKYQYIDQQFNEIFTSLSNFLSEQKTRYEENNYNKSIFNNSEKIYCIIIGIESFKTRLNDENKNKFADLFNNGKDLGIVNFIIVDSIDKIKKIEIESWYKNSVNNNFGIWIGNGINDQFSIKVSQKIDDMKENVPDNFCFVIKRGKAQYVKYVENLEIDLDKKQE